VELIEQYRNNAAVHAAIDFADDASVRRGNRAASSLRAIATQIGTMGQDAMERFGLLLDEPRDDIHYWAAFHLHILEVMPAPPALVNRAFALLEERARGDGAEALGTRMRLRELRRQHLRPDPPTHLG
jgi:hypothetical protein